MTDRTHLIATSPVETENSEIPSPRNYGSIPSETMENKTTLKFFEKIGFSLGHVFNDLAAALWLVFNTRMNLK